MPPLHRHQLVRLTDGGWRALRAACSGDDTARDCLGYWARERLPLVVTRQPPEADGTIALGLPAPLRWQRRRIALQAASRDVAWYDEFPPAHAVAPLLPRPARAPWGRLCAQLHALGARARVYGSHGWQRLTALPYLHADSDIDLAVAVDDAPHADAVAALLARPLPGLTRRLDGELLWPDGRAHAWREWAAWRSGRSRAILCRTLHGVALEWSAPPVRATARERAVTLS